ncbi:MAG: hypothetical protein GTO40_25110 [Deltaproteobacteria bacterium]|nr:hypothetical protein [Deltaproteobacteria bacterium]
MLSNRLMVRMWIIFSLLVLVSTQSQTELRAEDWLKGKSVRILIGYPPGGGHDLEARVMGRHLSKYLPGNPNVIVQNMPGAGGMIQGAYIYNRAKPDGRTLAVFGGSHTTNGVLRDPKELKYDMVKMPVVWAVGGVDVDIARDFLNARTAKELVKVEPDKIIVAGRSKGGSSCVAGQLVLSLLEIKGYRPVCAYAGTAVIRGAMERGEVSFFNASDAHLVGSGAFVDMYKRGLVYPMWQHGILREDGRIVRSPTVAGEVPTLFEAYQEVFGRKPSGPAWDAWKALNLGLSQLNRTLLLPPGTPPDRVATLTKGIARMAKDPKFVKDWERIFGQKLGPVLVSAREATKIKNEYMAPASWRTWLKKFVWG